ncbi:MAG: M20 aminoacylase family protein [Pseudomonadota bacterium]
MPIKNRLSEMQPQLTEWRRDIHRHPEILYDTHRTSALVADKLKAFGCDEVVTGIGRTGVVGVIRGRSDTKGRAIGLRADMDALPIHEATGLAHASETPGAMHACGHDGHTTMLLGAAQYLAETRNFDGTAVFLFQPAEEGGNGALAMVEDGVMDRFGIDEVYGMHNRPGLDVGQFAIRPGGTMAAVDQFSITLTGKGGHGAMPHLAVDPNVAAAHIVLALQTIASRTVDPLKQVVVSVCTLNADNDAFNVIPQTTRMGGTVRTLDAAIQDLTEDRLKEIATLTAAAHGCTAEVTYTRCVPVTVNAEEQTAFAADVAEAVAGSVDREVAPTMGGEDFSYMLDARPGAYIFVGNGDSASVHHPAYDFNDEAIPAGASWFAEIVERRMPQG